MSASYVNFLYERKSKYSADEPVERFCQRHQSRPLVVSRPPTVNQLTLNEVQSSSPTCLFPVCHHRTVTFSGGSTADNNDTEKIHSCYCVDRFQ